MTLPLREDKAAGDAQVLANRMRKLRLAETLKGITVEETPVSRVDGAVGAYGRKYRVQMQFYEPTKYPKVCDTCNTLCIGCFAAVSD